MRRARASWMRSPPSARPARKPTEIVRSTRVRPCQTCPLAASTTVAVPELWPVAPCLGEGRGGGLCPGTRAWPGVDGGGIGWGVTLDGPLAGRVGGAVPVVVDAVACRVGSGRDADGAIVGVGEAGGTAGEETALSWSARVGGGFAVGVARGDGVSVAVDKTTNGCVVSVGVGAVAPCAVGLAGAAVGVRDSVGVAVGVEVGVTGGGAVGLGVIVGDNRVGETIAVGVSARVGVADGLGVAVGVWVGAPVVVGGDVAVGAGNTVADALATGVPSGVAVGSELRCPTITSPAAEISGDEY